MVHAENYETVSTFVKIMQKKTVASFSGHCVETRIIGLHFCKTAFRPSKAIQGHLGTN